MPCTAGHDRAHPAIPAFIAANNPMHHSALPAFAHRIARGKQQAPFQLRAR
jgi:hypothetical protein